MKTVDARRLALAYLERDVDPEEFFARYLVGLSSEELLFALSELIASSEPEIPLHAMTLLLDYRLGLIGVHGKTGSEEVLSNDTSSVWSNLHCAMRSSFFSVRHSIVTTLGRLCFQSQIEVLESKLQSSHLCDPLLNPSLLGELSWLEQDETKSDVRLERLISSGHPFTRWSALAIISKRPLEGHAMGLLERLEKDAYPPLAREAGFLMEQNAIKTASPARNLTKSQRRLRRLQIERRRPVVEFENDLLMMRWDEHGAGDYTVADLEKYVAARTGTA
ncbi:MAG: hypothetical protein AAFU79_32320 [Myxococcota bacterium]